MIKILEEKGYDLKVERVVGGDHEWDVWKQQFEDMLVYFYN